MRAFEPAFEPASDEVSSRTVQCALRRARTYGNRKMEAAPPPVGGVGNRSKVPL